MAEDIAVPHACNTRRYIQLKRTLTKDLPHDVVASHHSDAHADSVECHESPAGQRRRSRRRHPGRAASASSSREKTASSPPGPSVARAENQIRERNLRRTNRSLNKVHCSRQLQARGAKGRAVPSAVLRSVCDDDEEFSTCNTKKTRVKKKRPSDTEVISTALPKDSLQTDGVKKNGTLDVRKPFECPLCGAAYAVFQSVRRHTLTVHGQTLPSYKCSLCGLYFEDARSYSQHKKEHKRGQVRTLSQSRDGKTFHYCPLCGAKFAHTYSLTTHMKIHKHAYFCELCAVLFDSSQSFTEHRRTKHRRRKREAEVGNEAESGMIGGRLGECPRQFQCVVCGAVFVHQATLVRHSLVHDHHKPFVCTVCFMTFRLPLDLKEHVNLHLVRHQVPAVTSPACEQDETSPASSGTKRSSGAKQIVHGKLVIPKLVKERRYSKWIKCHRCSQLIPVWLDEHKDCVQDVNVAKRSASPGSHSSAGVRQQERGVQQQEVVSQQQEMVSQQQEVVSQQQGELASGVPWVVTCFQVETTPSKLQVKTEPVDDFGRATPVQSGELQGEIHSSALDIKTEPSSPLYQLDPASETGTDNCWQSSDGFFSVKLEPLEAADCEEHAQSDISNQSWEVLVNDETDLEHDSTLSLEQSRVPESHTGDSSQNYGSHRLSVKFEPSSPTRRLQGPEWKLDSEEESFEMCQQEDRTPPELKRLSWISSNMYGTDVENQADWMSAVSIKREPVSLEAQLVYAFSDPLSQHFTPHTARESPPALRRGVKMDVFPVYLYRNGQIVQFFQDESL